MTLHISLQWHEDEHFAQGAAGTRARAREAAEAEEAGALQEPREGGREGKEQVAELQQQGKIGDPLLVHMKFKIT